MSNRLIESLLVIELSFLVLHNFFVLFYGNYMNFEIVSALLILILGDVTWLILLKNFSLKDELWRANRDRNGIFRFFSDFTNRFSSSNEVHYVQDTIIYRLAELIEADSFCVYVMEKDGEELYLRISSVLGEYPGLDEEKGGHGDQHRHPRIKVCRENLFGRVLLENRSVLATHYASSNAMIRQAFSCDCAGHSNYEDDSRVDSVMAVPMVIDGKVVGVICAVNPASKGYHFTPEDLKLLESIGSQVAIAQEILTIYTQVRDQQRIIKELELAEHIQTSLLPTSSPDWGDYTIVPFSSPAKEVGGDYYDFVQIDQDRLLVVVADASGKGIPAGMIMTMCRSSLHALVQNFTDLSSLLVDLNAILYKDTDSSHFITMAACIIDRSTNMVEYGRAGHTELLMLEDENLEMHTPDGTGLGLLPPEFVDSFEIMRFEFKKNMKLLMYSDGITEAFDRTQEEFGVERLCQSWKMALIDDNRDNLPSIIVEAVDNFTEYVDASDDRTIVFIERD